MAHFAKLGANGKVIQVLTLNNGDMLNADGVEDESVGQQYLETHNNWPAQMWIQTSYNTQGGVHKDGGKDASGGSPIPISSGKPGTVNTGGGGGGSGPGLAGAGGSGIVIIRYKFQ